MRKLWFSLLLLTAVMLSACSPAATPAAVSTATALPAPSATAPSPQPATGAAPVSGDTMQCTIESTMPTPSPADANRFAPITDKDWVQGPADAKVTILEYSDFM